MDTMYERCCGLDIHKKTIEACFHSGKKKTHMSFGTMLVCQTYVTPCLMKSWSVSLGDFHPSGRIGKQL